MSVINWKVSRAEAMIIGRIVKRAVAMAREHDMKGIDAMELSMDVTACHLNGCPLELAKLESAPDTDFAHDVFGIRRSIDRKTGQLQNSFLPRCSVPENVQ